MYVYHLCYVSVAELIRIHYNYTIFSAVPPPEPLFTMNNFLLENSNINNTVRLTIKFDAAFSMEHRVDTYCIRSQNRACPNDSCVPTDSNYTCDGLEIGREHNFTVRAVNCQNQESEESAVITITPQSIIRFCFIMTAWLD